MEICRLNLIQISNTKFYENVLGEIAFLRDKSDVKDEANKCFFQLLCEKPVKANISVVKLLL